MEEQEKSSCGSLGTKPSPEPNLKELRRGTMAEKIPRFLIIQLLPRSILKSQVAIINAWIKFSAARFCSGVPDIRAIRSPREDLESEISTIAPEIWRENKALQCYSVQKILHYIKVKYTLCSIANPNKKGLEKQNIKH